MSFMDNNTPRWAKTHILQAAFIVGIALLIYLVR